MCDDIIELTNLAEIENVALLDADIAQPKRLDQRTPARDLARGQVNPEKPGTGKGIGHRDQVAAARATELQHAASLRRRRLQTEQRGLHTEGARMRLADWHAVVRDLVITLCRQAGDVHRAATSSVIWIPAGHHLVQRPQPTQPLRSYCSCRPALCASTTGEYARVRADREGMIVA